MFDQKKKNFIFLLSGSDWREMGGSPQTSRELDTVVLQVLYYFFVIVNDIVRKS